MRTKLMALAAVVAMSLGAWAEPTVTDITAKQRYPWNGLVDITCKVSGIDGTTTDGKFTVSAVMPDTGDIRKLSHFWVVQNGMNSTDLKVHANGVYRLLWDARADFGQVIYSNMVVCVTLDSAVSVSHEKVQLWEGGPYWATTNIGADNPWDYGLYFWWGDTEGHRPLSDGTFGFSFLTSNCPIDGKGNETIHSEGWITSDGTLDPSHDAAHVKWGGSWRMPTIQEVDDLVSKCDWTRTTMRGVSGYVVRGKGAYDSNSIFLPCAGRGNGASLQYAGSRGFYWSSVPTTALHNYYYAYGFYFYEHSVFNTSLFTLSSGHSVRPVQGFTE